MLRSKAENLGSMSALSAGSREIVGSNNIYDAGVLATVARHGTTIKWSSPQAHDGWGGIGSGWDGGQVDGCKKNDRIQDGASEIGEVCTRRAH
jgi:hypothetical protein